MKVWVLTKIEVVGYTTRAFRDQWDAMAAAEQETGTPFVWSPPVADDAAHYAGEGAGTEYLLDELEVLPRSTGPKVTIATFEVKPPQARSVQYHANGMSLGAPDTTAPYQKKWTRPAGQDDPVEIEAQVVYEDGTTYRGAILTID